MNAPSLIPTDSLPTLINKATAALDNARSSAEVLEARDMAKMAYDAAKSAARIMKAKEAHDTLITEVHRSQAHALAIRARAEMRLAEEYDAAQDRGEVATGRPKSLDDGKTFQATSAGLGLRSDEIHEARKLRDAERAYPGIVQSTINNMIERGEEPTRANLKREIMARPEPKKTMNPKALWIWGRMKDFERDGVLSADPQALLAEMTEPMRQDMARILPLVRSYLEKMETKL
jgi:predicted transcriptional regulator